MALRETVAIRRENGHRSVIARDDYDPAKHTLWDAPAEPVEPTQPTAHAKVAHKRKGKAHRG